MQSIKPRADKFLPVHCAVLTALLTAVAYAEPELSVSPAIAIRYSTERGKYYQLQVKRDGDWKNVGFAAQGTGRPCAGLYPSGEYRVISPSSEWVMVWADEFDGDDLDFSKWEKEENNYGGGNNERQAYRTDPKYCFVKDGVLNLAVYRDPHTTCDGKTQPYSSARIRTQKRGEWKYGRFEVRAKMPKGQGIWPAVWMLPTESKYGGWAAGGEIDIIESRGSAVHETTGAIHFGGAWPRNTYLSHRYTFPEQDAAEAFHLYTLEWNADEIKWYVDGKLCRTRSKDEWFSEAARKDAHAPFDQPFHLIVNVAVDGRFFEKTDQRADLLPPDAFPQILEVDYIRVYQWAE
ncbi:MAG: glycoside hydrolase family 16 protein [Planctomycetes bacterium]|nr:glycoside hydrolase family 16 protein [Planctomycetota bacterium]MBL7043114.1 glycoside hydrolase family 16 protein [Pirellulaceae bacterium]